MRLILTTERPPANQLAGRRNGQLCGGTDYFGCPCFLLILYWLLMVTTTSCYHKAFGLATWKKLSVFDIVRLSRLPIKQALYFLVAFYPSEDISEFYLKLLLSLTAKWECK